MHIIHNSIGAPKITCSRSGDTEAIFTMAPLPSGYGVTLGNALRRIMLSSVPGARVTGVKIRGVTHEYSTIPGIKDSSLDILLNLKGLIVEKSDVGIEWINLKVSRAGAVTAADIVCPSNVIVHNPDLLITEIDRDGFVLDMSIRVEKGVGYLSIDTLKDREEDTSVLLVDANFSPVVNVKYEINDKHRVGEIMNLDSLALHIRTNGVMSPQDVMIFASNLLVSYFGLFNENNVIVEADFVSDVLELQEREQEETSVEQQEKETYTRIELLGLTPRTLNALVNGEITSVEQLCHSTEAKLSSIKGFGRKAMVEVRMMLKEKGYKLLGDE